MLSVVNWYGVPRLMKLNSWRCGATVVVVLADAEVVWEVLGSMFITSD